MTAWFHLELLNTLNIIFSKSHFNILVPLGFVPSLITFGLFYVVEEFRILARIHVRLQLVPEANQPVVMVLQVQQLLVQHVVIELFPIRATVFRRKYVLPHVGMQRVPVRVVEMYRILDLFAQHRIQNGDGCVHEGRRVHHVELHVLHRHQIGFLCSDSNVGRCQISETLEGIAAHIDQTGDSIFLGLQVVKHELAPQFVQVSQIRCGKFVDVHVAHLADEYPAPFFVPLVQNELYVVVKEFLVVMQWFVDEPIWVVVLKWMEFKIDLMKSSLKQP